jgi:hypothetical protein
MIRRQFKISLLLIFTLTYNSCIIKKNSFQKTEKYRISQIAIKELPQVLEKIPVGFENSYGFENRDEFLNSKVGVPFKFYTFKNNKLSDTSPYSVPIIVNNEFRALATVEYINDTLHIVDFGSNGLAHEIQSVCKNNNQFNFIGILRVYEIFSDFLIISNKDEKQFIPLTSAKLYLKSIGNKNSDRNLSEYEIVNMINNK